MDGWGGMKAGAVRDICRIHPFRKHRHDKIHFLSASHSFIFFSLFFFPFFLFFNFLLLFFSFLYFFFSLSLSRMQFLRERIVLSSSRKIKHVALVSSTGGRVPDSSDSVHYETITITARVSLRSVQLRMLSPCSRALI